jgi:hypothetical protein
MGRRWSAEYWQKRQGLSPTDKVAFDAELSEFDTNHQLRQWEHTYNCVRRPTSRLPISPQSNSNTLLSFHPKKFFS